MKKSLILTLGVLLLMVLSTGTVFAAVNGVEAKADDRNPAFVAGGMNDMMVKNANNDDLHFSRMKGHIMIPGNGGEKARAPVFKPMEMDDMTMTHLEPFGRVKQFRHSMD